MPKCRIASGPVFLWYTPSSGYCWYDNCTAGSKPIKKLFNVVNWELNKVYPYQKIISKCCELVKLCHIKLSGPVFWDTLYFMFICQ